MKTLAILTNGGDTCALNASIKSIRDNAYEVGYKKIYGIRRGYQGLLDGWIDDITHREIDVRIGGSFLGSMRESPTRRASNNKGWETDSEKCRIMQTNLERYNIDVLVVIGGDGTLQSTQNLQDWINQQPEATRAFKLLGFLKTIDNDIRTFSNFAGIEMPLCPGFPSAVRKIVRTIEDLRVTARTAERAFAVEIMGRDAGWLAAAGAFGGAEIVLIPEVGNILEKHYFDERGKKPDIAWLSKEIWGILLDRIIKFYQKNRNVLIAVGEGFEPPATTANLRAFQNTLKDLYGDRKKVGATEQVAIILAPMLQYYFWCLSAVAKHWPAKHGFYDAIDYTLEKEPSLPEEVIKFLKEVKGLDKKSIENIEKMKSSEKIKTLKGIFKGSGRKKTNGNAHPLIDWRIDKCMSMHLGVGELEDYFPEGQVFGSASLLSLPPFEFEIRPHRTDYVPRSGEPSAYDYKLVSVLGKALGQALMQGVFGVVPSVEKIVRYEELHVNNVKLVPIEDIQSKIFDSNDYYNFKTLQVSDKVTEFFHTITTGPESLAKAIEDIDRIG